MSPAREWRGDLPLQYFEQRQGDAWVYGVLSDAWEFSIGFKARSGALLCIFGGNGPRSHECAVKMKVKPAVLIVELDRGRLLL